MKKIAFFCIPAHGHTNPMLPVAAELVRRGDRVRFYSFNEFKEKIISTGAEFVSCDSFLPSITKDEEQRLKSVSTTEMTIQDIKITLAMDEFLDGEFKSFMPDVVYSDSVCFWGKLNAWKHNVALVVSTSTFAFNQLSSKYMKHSKGELWDMIAGLPKISKELKALEPRGYKVKNALSLVQNDNTTDTVVYTSKRFQPYSESFSDHYAFVGPSVFSKTAPQKSKARPLVYMSLGTVINERPDFYNKCAEALGGLDVDVIISRGKKIDEKLLSGFPPNIKTYPYVDQLDVLSKADAFITHCGMNSVSESLYMATPMVLYPQTGEQVAVAKRVEEQNAGIMLGDDSAQGIKKAVLELLNNKGYAQAAAEMSDDFRSCPGTEGAAEFIENAPHKSNGVDVLAELNKENGRFQLIYWLLVAALIVILGVFAGWNFIWIVGITAGVLSYPISQKVQKLRYPSIVKRLKSK
ncbi:MAG: glycosyl transferase [Ruminococcus sp.]|nr:glycosyl transferase [Ruminococcus sp.]